MTNRNSYGTVLSRRRHASLARELIKLCGGLDEAAEACRVGKSQLSDYQNPQGDGFMPADVMVDLEAYCGSAIYSGALAAERPTDNTPQSYVQEANELAAAVVRVLPFALAVEQDRTCAKARAALEDAVAVVLKEARDITNQTGEVVQFKGASQ